MSWFKQVPPESDPVVYAIPFFLILIAIELYVNWKEKMELYESKEAFASIGMGLGSLVINAVTKGITYAAFIYIYDNYRIFDLGWHWYTWVLLFFADDLTFYFHHRLCHEVRFFWAAHVNHHSSMKLNLATALRQSWAEQMYKYIWWSWLPLVGFPPLMILMMISISLIYQYWPHTELIKRLPRWYEFLFNTPSHHRVHHASNIRYLDQNHGGILIIWDRLFGTFTEERDDDKPIYGITTNIHTYNLITIASHEYVSLWHDVKRAPGLMNKLKYMFCPPGWSHDGADQRARTLRAQLEQKEKQQTAHVSPSLS